MPTPPPLPFPFRGARSGKLDVMLTNELFVKVYWLHILQTTYKCCVKLYDIVKYVKHKLATRSTPVLTMPLQSYSTYVTVKV